MKEEISGYFTAIPAEVRYCKTINANSKLLFGDIDNLCKRSTFRGGKGCCTATNLFFANLYNVSKASIASWIKQLQDAGFIKLDVLEDGTRCIYIADQQEGK